MGPGMSGSMVKLPTSRRALRLGGVGLMLGLVAAWPSPARAGTYDVVQCDPPYNRDAQELRVIASSHYSFSNGCATKGALTITNNSLAARDDRMRLYWPAPPATELVKVSGRANLANAAGHKARVYVTNPQDQETPRI